MAFERRTNITRGRIDGDVRKQIDRRRIITGHPRTALPRLRQKLSQFLRYYPSLKIGITGDPEGRFRGYRGQYDMMRLIYQTTSRAYVKSIERTLVAEYRENYDEQIDNEKGGGAGPVKGPPYYVYAVVKLY